MENTALFLYKNTTPEDYLLNGANFSMSASFYSSFDAAFAQYKGNKQGLLTINNVEPSEYYLVVAAYFSQKDEIACKKSGYGLVNLDGLNIWGTFMSANNTFVEVIQGEVFRVSVGDVTQQNINLVCK